MAGIEPAKTSVLNAGCLPVASHGRNCLHLPQTRKYCSFNCEFAMARPLTLKKKLLKVRPHQCERCKSTVWLDAPIPLELHHIDGNKKNDDPSNLQLLCPNCHALTPNYRGRKLKKVRKCLDCPEQISDRAKRCWSCAARHRNVVHPPAHAFKIQWPDNLATMVEASSKRAVARLLGVSDTSVRKRLVGTRGLEPPRLAGSKPTASAIPP